MKTKLVTAFYTQIPGFPFFGHVDLGRQERYLHSLRTISNTNEEIICYCNETQHELLKNHVKEFKLTNVELKISNIWDYSKSNRMAEIKKTSTDYNFYHEIDWNKLFLLEKEYDESYDYIYWIDVGISHRGLFLLKYNPYKNMTGFSKDYENYAFTGVFNKELFPKINNWVGDKLINIASNLVAHQPHKMNEILKTTFGYSYMTIGGILGGNVKNLKLLFNEFDIISDKILDANVIINHEALISHIEKIYPDCFKTYKFDTWYHNDYWKCTPVFDNDSIKDSIHFVHFFEKELAI